MTIDEEKPATAPAPPAVDPERSSAPPAHTGYLPASALTELAERTGTPVDAFGTLTVRPSAGALWSAIRWYLSFSPVPSGHRPVPLTVESCSRERDDDVADLDGSSGPALASARAAAFGALGGRAGRGLAGDRAAARVKPPSRPVYSLATSSVAFVWPPPPRLAADKLIALRDAHPGTTLQQAALRCAEEANGGVDKDEDGDKDKDADDVERTTFYLFYYRAGDPVANSRQIEALSEMLVACERGSPPLMRFAEEVLAWRSRLKSAPDLLARFPLMRFKLEGSYGHWHHEGLKRSRPAESVVLAGDLMETILADVEHFLGEATRTWYFRHGLPYRRAFLFYGPPGTGKTSTVRVIASKFRLSCCALSVANSSFSNQALGDALSAMPPDALLVLEDVDALFNENRSNKLENQLTFSGLLNALDGLTSVEGLVTVMTTNHIDRLERALIRGGRVDRRFRFDLPADEQLAKLFRSFYPEVDDALTERFVRNVRARREGDEARAVSTLQQLFIEMRDKSAEECVAGMDEFFKQHLQDGDGASRPSYMI